MLRPRLRWLGLAGALVVMLVVLALILLAATPAGLRLGLRFAPEGVTVGAIDGSLLTGFELRDLRVATPDADVAIPFLKVDPAPLRLAGGELRLRTVALGPTVVTLRTAPEEAAAQTDETDETGGLRPPELDLPVDLALERLTVDGLRVSETVDGEPVVALELTALAVSELTFEASRAALGALTVRVPKGELELRGSALFATPFAADLALDGRYEERELLEARLAGDERAYALTVASDGTVKADLAASLAMPWSEPRFDIDLELAVAELERFLDDPPVDGVSLSFSADGSPRSVEASSLVSLPGVADLELVNDFDLDLARGRIVVNRFEIAEVGLPGRLRASGSLSMDPMRPSELLVSWQDLARLRLDAGGLASDSGRLEVEGTPDDLALDLTADVRTSYGPGSVVGRLRHRPDVVAIDRLDVRILDGVLALAGSVAYGEVLDARGTLDVRDLDLSEVAGEPLELSLASRFDLHSVPAGLEGAIDITRLTGQVAGQLLDGRGRIELHGEALAFDGLTVRAGDNRLTVTGRYGPQVELDAVLDAPALDQLLPELAGSLSGELHASGERSTLAARVSLAGQGLAFEDAALESLSLSADVGLAPGVTSQVRGELRELMVAGTPITAVDLTVDGTSTEHRGGLDVSAAPADLSLAWRAAFAEQRYAGLLEALTITPTDFEPFALTAPTPFELAPDRQALGGPLCLAAAGSELCLDGRRTADELVASIDLAEVTLARFGPLVDAFAGAELGLEGLLSGSASLRSTAPSSGRAASWVAEARIDAPELTVRLPNTAEPFLLGERGLRLDASIEPSRLDLDLTAELVPTGRLAVRVSGDGAEPDAPIDGQLTVVADDLSAFAPLVPEAQDLRGRVRLEATVGGTVGDPSIDLDGVVADAGAAIPALGLELSAGQAEVTVGPGEDGRLSAGLRSGEGRVDVTGEIIVAERRAVVEILGERFLGMDTGEIRAIVSPELVVEARADRVQVRGTIGIPTLLVDLSSLEGSVSASPDVVVAGREEAAAALPLDLDVTVRLGDDVRLEGFGIDGQLSGSVRVSQRPGRAIVCAGQINVAGGIEAYGQELSIQRGRLLFASVPCDDPALAITARREIETIDGFAGVEVTGSAAFPELRLFSTPPREESEVLCMLVTGKGCGSADEDAVSEAVKAAGLSAGSAVTNRLGRQAGLDDLSLTSSDEFGGAGMTVGKYVSPRIYVSFGRSFANQAQYFETVYELTRHFEVSVRQALETVTAIRYEIELD